MKFLANLTLRKKITLLTALGLLVGIGVFSFLGIRAVNQATQAMLEDRLTTAHLMADYVDEAMGRALTEMKNTAQLIESDRVNDNLEAQIEALESTYSRLSIYAHSIYFIDERGKVLWSRPEAAGMDNINISFYPSVSSTISRGEPSISGLVLTPVTNVPVIFLTSHTKEGGEGNRSMLVVAIDLAQSSIGGFIRPIRLGETGYVEIVDESGIVISRTEPGPKLAPFEKSDHSGRFAALIAAGEPTQGLCHTCHEPVQKVERRDVLAFVPLSVARWGIVVRQSEEEALAPIYELRQNLLFSGAGFIAVAFLFVAITTRDVVSRIRMLTTASQRIADGDLISPVTTSGKDEVGILAQTFDNMRVKLKASYEERERLHQQLRQKEEIRSELLREIFSIQEEERKRIARELHDETSQALASLTAGLEVVVSKLPANEGKAKNQLRKTQALSLGILDDIHRLIYELRPTLLDDLGLVAATQWLLDNNLGLAGIALDFKTSGNKRRLSPQIESTLFRVIQEATGNIVRHAHAKNVSVGLYVKKTVVKVQIRDDGIGFDVQEAITYKNRPRGLGLLGMKERVELMNGTLNINSRLNAGTKIDIEIPL